MNIMKVCVKKILISSESVSIYPLLSSNLWIETANPEIFIANQVKHACKINNTTNGIFLNSCLFTVFKDYHSWFMLSDLYYSSI